MRARDVIGPSSPLSELLDGYEDRPGQLEMAEAVEDALSSERPLFVEAGTGTGKTLAYLVPAILSGKKIVVSTATKALQEQIFTKDLPLVARLLGMRGRTFDAALMKGLPNYLCKRRFDEMRISAGARIDSDRVLLRIVDWAKETQTGDRAELTGVPEDAEAWREVQSSSDTRIGSGCEHFDTCFVTRMRREAEEAQLVIVNHHLFFADLALRRSKSGDYASAIPNYDAVIFDEAHQIEDIATDFFGARVTSARVDLLVRDARRSLVAAGLLNALGGGGEGRPLLELVSEAGARFFSALSARARTSAEPRRVLSDNDLGGDVRAAHGKLDACLESLSSYAEAHDRNEAIALIARRTRDLRADLKDILSGVVATDDGEVSKRVAWVDVRERGLHQTVSIGSSPVDLGPTLRSALFDRVPGVICTSATLATASTHAPSFHFAKARLGAPPETRELVVPSPFDVAARAALYLPRDLPEPADPAFEGAAVDRIVELVTITGGGAFVLCTSTRAMRAIHRALGSRLTQPLFVQGEAPKHVVLDKFRKAGHAVLVATMSFWEGVDVPGHALRLVILDKIPFAVPSEPVVAARCAQIERDGGNPFAQYVVPVAAITLKQGFGRLLRTQRDAGIVAILDKRIVTKGYGKALLASLPPAARMQHLEQVRAFWEGMRFEASAP